MRVEVAPSYPTLCDPMDYRVHGILQAKMLEWVDFLSPGDLPNPGIEPRSPALQVDSSPAEPPEKPKNTGVGSLSLLQRIFLTQELNQGVLPCRWILYQLSYQGDPLNIHKLPYEEGLATHSRILAWRIPWTEEPGLQPTVLDTTEQLSL